MIIIYNTCDVFFNPWPEFFQNDWLSVQGSKNKMCVQV